MVNKKRDLIFLIVGICGFCIWLVSLAAFIISAVAKYENPTLMIVATATLFMGALMNATAIAYYVYKLFQNGKKPLE